MKNENLQKTNLGINVPDGWEIVRLKDLFDEKKILSSDSEKYPLYSFTIENGVCPKSDRYNREHLLKNKAENKYRIIHKDDFIYNPMNLRFGALGRSKIKFPVAVSAYYNIFESKDKSDNNYLEAYLKSPRIMNIYDRVAIGSLLEKKRVHMSIFENIEIPYPPKKERDFIAQILTTWDTAIEKTEQLLTQLRRRKQGLMQRLLSGKQRLPGFVGEWEEVRLGDCLKFGSGKDYKHLSDGNIPVYGTGGLMTYVNEFLYDGESVGIGRKGTIDKPVFLEGKFWTVDTLFFTHSFSGILPKYTFYVFLLIPWKKYNEASGVPSLSKKTISNIDTLLPSIKEQTAIAAILTQADQEIEKTENYLTKLREQKKGLMQQLLTGQRRVKLN